jgi:hypothetical protein
MHALHLVTAHRSCAHRLREPAEHYYLRAMVSSRWWAGRCAVSDEPWRAPSPGPWTAGPSRGSLCDLQPKGGEMRKPVLQTEPGTCDGKGRDGSSSKSEARPSRTPRLATPHCARRRHDARTICPPPRCRDYQQQAERIYRRDEHRHTTLIAPSTSPLPKSRTIARAGPPVSGASFPGLDACLLLRELGDPFRDGLPLRHQLGAGFVLLCGKLGGGPGVALRGSGPDNVVNLSDPHIEIAHRSPVRRRIAAPAGGVAVQLDHSRRVASLTRAL